MIVLPPTLVDQIKRGQAVLFFGAGASFGSTHADGRKVPLGDILKDLICDEFLHGTEKNRTLEDVANFAENEHGRADLDRFIAAQFKGFVPNQALKMLPDFLWQAIFTTNYDCLVEDAYDAHSDAAQSILMFHKDINGLDKLIGEHDRALAYYKLHGTIDRLYELDAPLVITSDSYIDVRENRARLFNRLIDAASDFPMIFIGTRLADPHIKAILRTVDDRSGSGRPMYYLVAPDLTENDTKFLATKRITPIKCGFDEFMNSLDASVDKVARRIYGFVRTVDHPIQRFFNSSAAVPPNLDSFLTDNVEYVHSGITSTPIAAGLFFKGESQNWSAIEQSFDVERRIYDSVMLRLMEIQRSTETGVDVVLIKGVAGSGKSVFLRRLAFDLATKYSQLVLFAPPAATLRPEPLVELFENTGLRAVLAVDQAADTTPDLERICQHFTKANVPLTLVLTDTEAAIGSRFSNIDYAIRDTRFLRNLDDDEIGRLIKRLEQLDCLGHLKERSDDERLSIFKELAEKQLLVALYEATQGRPLEDILVEEYHRILYDEAQELYLLVCTLHRFRVPVRAGLVRRLMGISFPDFESRFLEPLQDLVFAAMDPRSRDYCYRTRHPQVADIVFRRILDTQNKQVDQFLHIMRGLNTTYSSDNDALRKMINFHNLRDLVTSVTERRKILDVAQETAPNDPFVLQQQAMLEMNSPKGDLQAARAKLDEAQSLNPKDVTIKHSMANLLAREAERETDWLAKKSLRASAKNTLREIRSNAASEPYIEALIAKLAIDELEDRLGQYADKEQANSDREILRLVEDAEKAIGRGLVVNSDFDGLTRESVRLANVLGEKQRGLRILSSALESNSGSKFCALAYSRAIQQVDISKAKGAIRNALQANNNDKQLNQALFEILVLESDDFRSELAPFLDKAFTSGDGNLMMHIHAMRYHFMRGQKDQYDQVKAATNSMQVDRQRTNQPRFPVGRTSASKSLWAGKVIVLSSYYGFIETPEFAENVFFSVRSCFDDDTWDEIGIGSEVEYSLCFNSRGAIADNLRLRSS